MTYRLDIYADPTHLAGVRVITAPTGVDADAKARTILATVPAVDHADLFVLLDGEPHYYETIPAPVRAPASKEIHR